MIHICFNLDKNYIDPCKILMRNIEALTKEDITYHLLGVEPQNMQTKKQCKFYPNLDLSCFTGENLKSYYYFSQAAMYRLLIPFVVETDKALYLDIDTLVRHDIKTLWGKSIDLVGAVIDPCNIYHRDRLGIDSDNYFNSGVILFNSKKIREQIPDYTARILQAQKDYVLDLKDQDIFNVVFKDHITSLGYEFNMDAHNLKEKDEEKTISDIKDKAFKDPAIVHCMGKNKWWNYEGLSFGDEWDYYAGDDVPRGRKKCIRYGEMMIMRN